MKQVVEGLIRRIWKEIKSVDMDVFRCMPYQVAMDVVSAECVYKAWCI